MANASGLGLQDYPDPTSLEITPGVYNIPVLITNRIYNRTPVRGINYQNRVWRKSQNKNLISVPITKFAKELGKTSQLPCFFSL